MGSLGIIANPMSGRDSRRLTARAESVSHESKRNQISRIVVGRHRLHSHTGTLRHPQAGAGRSRKYEHRC